MRNITIIILCCSRDEYQGAGNSRASGFVNFSLSPFQVINLVDGDAFPGYASQRLQFYDDMGNRVEDDMGNDLLYLPFIDFECILNNVPSLRDIPSIQFVTLDDPLKYVLPYFF